MIYFDDFEDGRLTGRTLPYQNLTVGCGTASIVSTGQIRGLHSVQHIGDTNLNTAPLIYPIGLRLGDNERLEVVVRLTTIGTGNFPPRLTIMGFQYTDANNWLRLETIFWNNQLFLRLMRNTGGSHINLGERMLHSGQFHLNQNYVFQIVRSGGNNWRFYYRIEPSTTFEFLFEILGQNPGFVERIFFGAQCTSTVLYDNIKIDALQPSSRPPPTSTIPRINMLSPVRRKKPRVHFIPGRDMIISNVIGADLTPPETRKPDYETRTPKSSKGQHPPRTRGQQGRFNHILWYTKKHRRVRYVHYTGHRFTWEQVIQRREGNCCDLARLVNRIATQTGLVPLCGDPLPQVNYVQGRVFYRGRNYTHVWCEVMVNGRWRTIDMVHYLLSGCPSVFGRVTKIHWKRNAVGINPC